MCLTAPARVLSVEEGVAVVELDGRRRRALLAVATAIGPGDWVMVGAGMVLRRLDPADAAAIRQEIDAARSATRLDAADPTRPEGAQR
jgi:hydrogenase expression/formation protein HypC